MEECPVPSLAVEGKIDSEFSSSKEPLLIEVDVASSDDATVIRSEMNEADPETCEDLENKLLSVQCSNGITTDEENVEVVAAGPCECQKELVTGQHHKVVDLLPLDHSKDIVVEKRAEIDTAAPFKSVKQAVNMFGGVANWKAQRNLITEARQYVVSELQKAREEVAELKKHLIVAEDEKLHILRETDKTRMVIEELTLRLERAQAAEEKAAERFELPRLREKEMRKHVPDEASVACRGELEVASGSYASAVADLQVVNQEFEYANSEYMSLINSRDIAIKCAENMWVASQETREKMEDLIQKLISRKTCLDESQATHMQAEEQQIAAGMNQDKELENRQKEIINVNWEIGRLYHEVAIVRDLITKLEASSSLLQSLKEELAVVKESEFKLGTNLAEAQGDLLKARDELELARVAKFKAITAPESIVAELQETKMKLNEATGNIRLMRFGIESLRKELEEEHSLLEKMHQRVAMASAAVDSLKIELGQAKEELRLSQDKERQADMNMKMLTGALQQAATESDETKSAVVAVQEEIHKAKQEIKGVRAATSTAECRLHAAIKLAEAARASEALALGEIKALNESKSTAGSSEPRTFPVVTLCFEKYRDLCRRAYQAEELANKRVAYAMVQTDAVTDGQVEVLKRLEEANKEILVRREALQGALQKAEMANAGKLAAEDELRKWRAEHGRHRKLAGVTSVAKQPVVPHGPIVDGKNLVFLDENNLKDNKEQIISSTKTLASLGQLLNMTVASPENRGGEQPSKDAFASKKKSRLPRFSLPLTQKKKSLNAK